MCCADELFFWRMSLDLIYHECYVNSTVINTLFEFAINQSVLDVIGSIGAVTAALLYSTAIPTLIQFFRWLEFARPSSWLGICSCIVARNRIHSLALNRSRNTGNRYIWPFIVMFLNCSLWLLYGWAQHTLLKTLHLKLHNNNKKSTFKISPLSHSWTDFLWFLQHRAVGHW